MSLIARIKESLQWRWEYFTQLDHCPVGFQWFAFSRERHPSDALHALALSRPPRQAWVRAGVAVAWPIAAVRQATRLVWTKGPDVRKRHGVGLARQWGRAVRMALRHNMNPDGFYAFDLWGEEGDRVHEYVQHHEILRIMPKIQNGLDDEVHDKVSFFRACRRADIPTAPILALFRPDGSMEWLSESAAFPEEDLFIKPSDMWRSLGAQRWNWTGDGQWERQGYRFGQEELIEQIGAHVEDSVVLVQPALRNHPHVEPLTNGGLGTLRIMTCRVPGHPTTWFYPLWKMPVGASEVNLLSLGGIVAAVDRDGIMSAAVADGTVDRITHHPDTGAPIEGRPLPGFHEMAEMAVLTHERLGGPYFVGWDVYLGPDGPAMLEGNPTWGVQLPQMAHRRPLGSELRFVEGVAHALRHRAGQGEN